MSERLSFERVIDLISEGMKVKPEDFNPNLKRTLRDFRKKYNNGTNWYVLHPVLTDRPMRCQVTAEVLIQNPPEDLELHEVGRLIDGVFKPTEDAQYTFTETAGDGELPHDAGVRGLAEEPRINGVRSSELKLRTPTAVMDVRESSICPVMWTFRATYKYLYQTTTYSCSREKWLRDGKDKIRVRPFQLIPVTTY